MFGGLEVKLIRERPYEGMSDRKERFTVDILPIIPLSLAHALCDVQAKMLAYQNGLNAVKCTGGSVGGRWIHRGQCYYEAYLIPNEQYLEALAPGCNIPPPPNSF